MTEEVLEKFNQYLNSRIKNYQSRMRISIIFTFGILTVGFAAFLIVSFWPNIGDKPLFLLSKIGSLVLTAVASLLPFRRIMDYLGDIDQLKRSIDNPTGISIEKLQEMIDEQKLPL